MFLQQFKTSMENPSGVFYVRLQMSFFSNRHRRDLSFFFFCTPSSQRIDDNTDATNNTTTTVTTTHCIKYQHAQTHTAQTHHTSFEHLSISSASTRPLHSKWHEACTGILGPMFLHAASNSPTDDYVKAHALWHSS